MSIYRSNTVIDGVLLVVILSERRGKRQAQEERMGRQPARQCCGQAKKELAAPFADSHPGPTGIKGTIDFNFFLMIVADIFTITSHHFISYHHVEIQLRWGEKSGSHRPDTEGRHSCRQRSGEPLNQ